MVIYNGKLDYNTLKKSKLDVNDVIGMCREQGYFDLSDVAFAVFENSGKLSIMPVSAKVPALAKDVGVTPPPPALPFYTVVDGRISFSYLSEMGKTREWLFFQTKHHF